MSKILTYKGSSPWDFGSVSVGATGGDGAIFLNEGDEPVIVTAIDLTIGTQFTLSALPSLPTTIAVGDILNFGLNFVPTATGTKNDILTVVSDSISNPDTIPLTGKATTGKQLTVNPSSFAFANTKVGEDSAEKLFVVTNTGDNGNVVVTAVASGQPDYTQVTGLSDLPKTIAQGAAWTIGIKYTPADPGYIASTITLTSDAVDEATFFVEGNGYLITPAYPSVGLQKLLVAFGKTIKQFDPNSFNCEEASVVRRSHDAGLTGVSKTWTQVFFAYEDTFVGPSVITVQLRTTKQVQVLTVSLTGVNDGLIRRASALPFTVDAEITEVSFSKTGSSGPLIITDYILKFLPEETLIGTSAKPASVDSVFTVDGTEQLLCAIGSLVLQFDPTDFNCEEAASVAKSHVYPFPTGLQSGGMFPSYGYEKQIARILFHYIDRGVVTVTVRGTTVRGQSAQEIVTVGTVGADGETKLGFANFEVVDELMDLFFLRDAGDGPLEICDYLVKYAVKGEVTQP